MRTLFTLLLVAALLSACHSSYVTVNVLQPAQITIPSKINKLVFINRSLPEKSERFKNILEGAVTGESILADRHGAQECIKGVMASLNNSPRFQVIAPGNIELQGTGTREFPPVLDWNMVEDICAQNKADALITLETFDSDNAVRMEEHPVERKDGEKVIKYIEFTAFLNVDVESGWRIYYPAEKVIIDQNAYRDGRSWSNKSDSKKRAEEGLPFLDKAVTETGYYAGQRYAYRISPMWISVSRYYYGKGNKDFETADRFGKTGDWKSAADIWIKYVNAPDQKIAGNACYNMALAEELEGNLEKALEWARKSYTQYNNSKGRYYANILQQRIMDKTKLDEQMQK